MSKSKKTTPTVTAEDRRAAALAKAEAARRQAEALEALLRLDISSQVAQIEAAEKRIASSRRTIERAEREITEARAERDAAVEAVREQVVSTGAAPAVAADTLGVSRSWCESRTPSTDEVASILSLDEVREDAAVERSRAAEEEVADADAETAEEFDFS